MDGPVPHRAAALGAGLPHAGGVSGEIGGLSCTEAEGAPQRDASRHSDSAGPDGSRRRHPHGGGDAADGNDNRAGSVWGAIRLPAGCDRRHGRLSRRIGVREGSPWSRLERADAACVPSHKVAFASSPRRLRKKVHRSIVVIDLQTATMHADPFHGCRSAVRSRPPETAEIRTVCRRQCLRHNPGGDERPCQRPGSGGR